MIRRALPAGTCCNPCGWCIAILCKCFGTRRQSDLYEAISRSLRVHLGGRNALHLGLQSLRQEYCYPLQVLGTRRQSDLNEAISRFLEMHLGGRNALHLGAGRGVKGLHMLPYIASMRTKEEGPTFST